MKWANFFWFCFILYKEKMLTDKATIIVRIKDWLEAPQKPIFLKLFLILLFESWPDVP